MICPACGHDNIDGIDSCEQCLGDLRLEDIPRPSTPVERQIMETPISGIEPHDPPRFRLTTNLRTAISAMREGRHGCVLVVDDDGHLDGILTERDVLRKIAGRDDLDLDKETLAQHARRNPETVRPDDTLQVAINRMAVGGFRHLPIDGGPRAGLITARDVLNFIESNFRETVTKAFKRPGSLADRG